MKRLTRKRSLELLKKYYIKGSCLKHSLAVNRFAVSLAKKLKQEGKKINIYLVDMGSLLHDIGRSLNDKTKIGHEKEGRRILEKEGFAEIGEIAEKHFLGAVDKLKTWEEKIVFYADKRVEEDKVVDINERFKGLEKRHPEAVDLIRKVKVKIEKLEKEILS